MLTVVSQQQAAPSSLAGFRDLAAFRDAESSSA